MKGALCLGGYALSFKFLLRLGTRPS